MSMQSRTPQDASIGGPPLRAQASLTVEELAAAAGVTPTALARLVRLGLVEPVAPGATEFAAAAAARLRRLLRLHADLGVNLAGAAILVDLLARCEALEAELARLRGMA